MLNSSSRVAVCAALLVTLCALPQQARADTRRIVLAPDTAPVAGERRLALVIGNAQYSGDGVTPLKNPEHDAKAVAQTLQSLGFTVTELLDADRSSLRDAVHSFSQEVALDGPRTVALFYYSGHGMQVNGSNYLIPTSFTSLPNELDIDDYAYPVGKALDEMQGARARVTILILDACRDNPYEAHRSLGGKGLAAMKAAGVFIAYATAEGKTADDNTTGQNGLYTQELLKALATPGLNIHQVFQSVRRQVVADSEGAQFPYDDDGLLDDDFYFVPNAVIMPPPPPIQHGDTQIMPVAPVADSAIEAARSLCQTNSVDVHDASAVTHLGLNYYNDNDNENANTLFAAAVALSPGEALYRLNHASTLLNLNHWDEAKAEDHKAIDLGWHEAHWTFGYFEIDPSSR